MIQHHFFALYMKNKYRNYMLLEFGLDIIMNKIEYANNDSYLVNPDTTYSYVEMKANLSICFPRDISYSISTGCVKVYHDR